MNIQLNPFDLEFAAWIHGRYRTKPGAEHIASLAALAYLSATLRTFRPQNALELGAGIGTMTDAILLHPLCPEMLWTIEQNEFCRGQLALNLSHHDKPSRFNYAVIETPAQLVSHRLAGRIDLLIGDGGFGITQEIETLHARSVVFAEGIRRDFREMVDKNLPRGCTIAFEEFGVTHSWGFGALPFLWRYTALKAWPTRLRRKGCWIGQVKSSLPGV